MNINFDAKRISPKSCISILLNYIIENEKDLKLSLAEVFLNFPVYKDQDDKALFASLLICSEKHGFLVFGIFEGSKISDRDDDFLSIDQDLENVYSAIFSKLVRNKALRKTKTELLIPINSCIFCPNVTTLDESVAEAKLCNSLQGIKKFLEECVHKGLTETILHEAIGTIDGSKGIIKAKPRNTENLPVTSRGVLACQIESEINQFDKEQKLGGMSVLDGLERIRGLAGSGKTVVLAMKAALTHLRDPEAIIAFTFFTKSLYQQIKRLITRFYRQFDDKDPDWDRIKILHGWGGFSGEGIYFNICRANGIQPLSLPQAKAGGGNPFEYACCKVLEEKIHNKLFDYVFIDEGQDFPSSFVQLCLKSTRGPKVVLAYDEFQTIFQPSAPDLKAILDVQPGEYADVEVSQDIVLKKCYRNPREIIVVAHAIGLGVYANFVQILENAQQWEDLGYKVVSGDFSQGSFTKIERPSENSLLSISKGQSPEEIVKAYVCNNIDEEIEQTILHVKEDLKSGLRPDDILVTVVDDRNAKAYLSVLSRELLKVGVHSNNIHNETYGIRDFSLPDHVTLSTVHKAKGNEAYSVYVLGIDALNRTYPGPRERNILFTAMTRAKGWVCISGIGEPACQFQKEVDLAVKNFPFLQFDYPDAEKIRIIKRDIEEFARRKSDAERKLAEIMEEFTLDEIQRFYQQRGKKKRREKK